MRWPFSGKAATEKSGDIVETSPSPHTRFAFRLFRELCGAHDGVNIFFSPSSVMLCLALVYELASEETRQSIARALEIAALDQAGMESEMARLKSGFRTRSDAEVSFANALFLGKHAGIESAKQERLRALYDAELNAVDFSSPSAMATINTWVQSKSRGKIREIAKDISPLAVLVALNAVYFKSLWLKPFRRELTRDLPFRTASGGTKQCPMMWQTGRYRYYEGKAIQFAAIPYCGEISMYIVLPSSKTDVSQFRLSLDSGLWESWSAKSDSMPGTIQLPRFRVDYGADLSQALCVLGMQRAFDRDRAQFDRVKTDLPTVWLDQVVHRAVAEVNEEGTEAAAATMAHVLAAAMNPKTPKTFEMMVDHPFLAILRDEATKAILFMGWIGDPQ